MNSGDLYKNELLDDRYMIGDTVLGKGSFGIVRKGIDIKENRFVACKIIPQYIVEKEPKHMQLFLQEISAMYMLDSDNIVRLYKDYLYKGNFILIMEYCEGGDLEQYLAKKGPIPEKEAIGLLLQILEGFRDLHSKQIIHRDLKAQNILLQGKSNRLKVGDLGCSRQLDEQSVASTCVGSPRYMAPEICTGENYGPEVDAYSLGVLLYRILLGRFPFEGATQFTIYENVKQQKPNFQRQGVTISVEMENFIRRLLKFERAERIKWNEIRRHPIIVNAQMADKKLSQLLAIPQDLNSEQEIYQENEFFENQNQQENFQSILSAKSMPPSQISNRNYGEECQKVVHTQFLSSLKEQIDSCIKFVLKKQNAYKILIHLIQKCQQYKQLESKYTILSFLMLKKLRFMNKDIHTCLIERTNSFKLDCFKEFTADKSFEGLKRIIDTDKKTIEDIQVEMQKAAIQTFQLENNQNTNLWKELGSVEPLPPFQDLLIDSIGTYWRSFVTIYKKETDPERKKQFALHLQLLYIVCAIDSISQEPRITFDFSLYKRNILSMDLSKFEEFIKEKVL